MVLFKAVPEAADVGFIYPKGAASDPLQPRAPEIFRSSNVWVGREPLLDEKLNYSGRESSGRRRVHLPAGLMGCRARGTLPGTLALLCE